MSFLDEAKKVLSGGLPAVLDFPGLKTAQQGDQPVAQTAAGAPKRVETTPPAPSPQSTEPFLIAVQNKLTPANIAIGVGGLVLVAVIVVLARR